MRKILVGFLALAITALGANLAVAKGGKGKGHGNAKVTKVHKVQKVKTHKNTAHLRGLARADAVAGTHGMRGRDIARTRGANSPGFCPPGQEKKPGLGSRFQC